MAKRTLDVLASAVFLSVFGLPMLCIAILIRRESKGPAIFKQKRVGLGGREFTLYKYRSMRMADCDEESRCHEERVTPIGAFIRKWRVDEIPQFFNVLKGDMSLVGPRPTLPYQVERYDEEQKKRLQVKPGLTGWAQIHGDEAVSWPERIILDKWYIENWSFWLDVKILVRTPISLFKISKINAECPPPPDNISDLEEV